MAPLRGSSATTEPFCPGASSARASRATCCTAVCIVSTTSPVRSSSTKRSATSSTEVAAVRPASSSLYSFSTPSAPALKENQPVMGPNRSPVGYSRWRSKRPPTSTERARIVPSALMMEPRGRLKSRTISRVLAGLSLYSSARSTCTTLSCTNSAA